MPVAPGSPGKGTPAESRRRAGLPAPLCAPAPQSQNPNPQPIACDSATGSAGDLVAGLSVCQGESRETLARVMRAPHSPGPRPLASGPSFVDRSHTLFNPALPEALLTPNPRFSELRSCR